MACSDRSSHRVIRAFSWAFDSNVLKAVRISRRLPFYTGAESERVATRQLWCTFLVPETDWGGRWGFLSRAAGRAVHYTNNCNHSRELVCLRLTHTPKIDSFSHPFREESSQKFGSCCGISVPHSPSNLCCGQSYSLFVRKCSDYLDSAQLQKVALRLVSYRALKRKPSMKNKIAALKAVEKIVPGRTQQLTSKRVVQGKYASQNVNCVLFF